MGMNCRFGWKKIVLLVILGIAVLGAVVMALWNWLVPALFAGGREISYPQALGLLVLSKILFGGFRGRGGWRECGHVSRWEQMSPEEREKFKAGMGCWFRKGREEKAGIQE